MHRSPPTVPRLKKPWACWIPFPGVARQTAEIMVAEIGTDMGRFPTADHLAAWAGVAPGHHESAGKRRSGRRARAISRWALP